MTVSSPRTVAARWIAGADPAGLLYGAIVSAAVLATVSAHAEGTEHVVIATGVVLGTYWLAHVYINALSTQFGGDRRPLPHRLRTAARHEVGVLEGGLPAIAVYLLAAIAGAGTASAALAALYFSVVLLLVVGYLGAHRAGHTGRAAVVEASGAGFFGVMMIVAKTLLH